MQRHVGKHETTPEIFTSFPSLLFLIPLLLSLPFLTYVKLRCLRNYGEIDLNAKFLRYLSLQAM